MMESVLCLFTKFLAFSTAFIPMIRPSKETNALLAPVIPGIIPGGSNGKFCNESRDTDLFSIERLSVFPTPPQVEEGLTVYLYGTFLKDITPNATWEAFVANAANHNLNETDTFWFCDAMEWFEQPNPDHIERPRCPPVQGWAMVSVHAWVPWIFGSGNFYMKFDAKTKEGERIYCIDGDVEILPRKRDLTSTTIATTTTTVQAQPTRDLKEVR